MINMTMRNIKLFLRDRLGVFFSFLAVIILFALYALFLGDTVASGYEELGDVTVLITSWIMSGVVAVAAVTTTMGAFGIMVDDRSQKISKDFFVSPVKRWQITGGYLLAAILIGILMTLITFVLSEVYIIAKGGSLLGGLAMVQMLGTLVLSVCASSSMVFFMVSFFHTQTAFSSASTVIGTMIGFLTGMYVPIGVLPGAVQWVVKCFPISHSVALIRQIFVRVPLAELFSGASAAMVEEFEESMGIFYWYGGTRLSSLGSVMILLATTALFFLLSVWNLSRKKT